MVSKSEKNMVSKSEKDRVPKGYQKLNGSERPRSSGAKLLGPLDPKEIVSATLVLRHKPGSPALPDHQHWQKTPINQRQFLSPKQYAETYGASQSDLDAVTSFVTSHGLTVLSAHAGRRTVSISGTAAQMNAVFGIQLNRYESPRPEQRRRTKTADEESASSTHIHHGYEGPVHIPAELSGIITAVIGLDNRAIGGPGSSSGDPVNSNPLSVPRVANLYNFPNPGASDQVIGVIAPSDPVGTTNQRLSGYLANDINNYFSNLSDSTYRTNPASLNDINLTVGTNTYSNSTATVQAITAADLNTVPTPAEISFAMEVTQDISTAATIAQGAAVNVYFTEITEQGLLVCLNRILLPEGESQPTVVTCSFNFFGSDDSGSIGNVSNTGSAAHQMSSLFQELALLGIGVFIIAQDRGSNDGDKDGKTHMNYPGSDPWVTCVGGTVIGNINPGPPITFDEFVWSNVGSATQVGGFGGATGGGASANFPAPSYQTSAGITSITDSKGKKSTNKRFIPDVAGMVSYGGSGSQDWFQINGLDYNFTGTSCTCPLFAGLYAALRSAFGVPLGFFNPTIYQIGSSVCNDITIGNNDPSDGSNAPFYNAAAGWDPCTGWGSIDGTKLLNGIAGLMYNQTFYFQIEKSSYGLDEVSVNSSYSPAFWLVLEGFTFTAAKNITPKVSGAFSTLTGVTITVGAATPEISSAPDTPQRVFYPCSITFASSAINTVANGGVFPAPSTPAFSLPLTALITISGQIFAAASVFELAAGADPCFANFNANGSNVFYLSEDLRVFTVTPGINNAPIAGVPLLPANNTKYDSGAAYNYIQALLAVLNAQNGDATGPDVFTSFSDQSSALIGDSSVTPNSVNPANPTGTRFSNYNFAVARVRLNGTPNTSSVKNVRVFFRFFATETGDTDYITDWTYPSIFSGAFPSSPLIGTGNPPVTIPFFATGNYEGNGDHPINVDYSADSINNQPIQIGASGKTWAYYGCYINVYPTNNTIGGKSIQSLLPGTHHCIVAQIAFDDAPIINSNGINQNPENSDKLAQRNLEITFSDNPGPASTHRIPQTFDTRRSPILISGGGNLLDYPDELMIDWGNTPVGASAHIYWPQVNASDVLSLAKKLYSTHQLSAADANTIHCKVPHGFTYVPIPPGVGENYAGLFTVDLPPGVVVAGQVLIITVRRISTRRADITLPLRLLNIADELSSLDAEAIIGKKMVNWRYVTGSFAVRIPVTTSEVMLPFEEDTLAIMKWRLTQMLPTNRWYPVLVRYISYLSGRVDGLGGNSNSIPPNPYGAPPSQIVCEHYHEFTGKVMCILYDRFGDFEGFTLLTEEGCEKCFHARECKIEALVRTAWVERMVITVFVDHDAPQQPVSIGLRRAH